MGVHYEAPKIIERVELTGLLSQNGIEGSPETNGKPIGDLTDVITQHED